MPPLTDESQSRRTSEAETSAALDSSNDRPSPGMVESSAPPNTGQESQQNIDEEVLNRQAAVVYILGPEAEKLESFSSSSDRLVVPVDLEISQLLTNEDLEKEKIPETADDSDDGSRQAVVEDGVRADTEVQENSSTSDTLAVPVDSEISRLPTNEDLRKENSPGAAVEDGVRAVTEVQEKSSSSDTLAVPVDSDISRLVTNEDLEKEKGPGAAHHSDDESDQIKHKDALLLSMEEGQLHSAGLGDEGPVPVPEDEVSVVPPPPALELQRNLHTAAAPGAFSVLPQEEHRFRDMLLVRSQNPSGDVESIAPATPNPSIAEPQVANGETPVYATLVPSSPAEVAPSTVLSSSITDEYERGDYASSNEACLTHAEGMSCWAFVKRSHKAQCGIVVAILFFFFLVVALVYILTWDIHDDDDKLLPLPPLTTPPQNDTVLALQEGISPEGDMMTAAPTSYP